MGIFGIVGIFGLICTCKEVVHFDLGLHDATVGVWFDSVGGNHDQLQGFARPCDFAEDLHFLAELFFVVFVDDIIANGEFDFADVGDVVATVDDEIDLRFATVGASLPG